MTINGIAISGKANTSKQADLSFVNDYFEDSTVKIRLESGTITRQSNVYSLTLFLRKYNKASGVFTFEYCDSYFIK